MDGAEGRLMGLGDSCHHCQGGAHMLCTVAQKLLNSQLPIQPANIRAPVPLEAPAAGSRQAGPVLLQSQGGRFEGRDSGLLSCDCPVVKRPLLAGRREVPKTSIMAP